MTILKYKIEKKGNVNCSVGFFPPQKIDILFFMYSKLQNKPNCMKIFKYRTRSILN